jgi:group I intron endonuclease
MIGIYKITSPNKRIYIGQSIDIKRRLREYSNNRCKSQVLLFNSIKKYGFDNHKFEIVCECAVFELNEKERYYQELFSCVGKKGLNLTLTKSSDRSGAISEDTRIKLSLNNSKFWLGKTRSLETKEKISKKLCGNKMSKEAKDKMSKNNSKFWLNKKLSINHKNKLSLAKKGKPSNVARILIDISNGVFYMSIREASIVYDIKETTLIMQLKGVNKNKTNLRYA